MRLFPILCLAMMAGISPALASGGLSCSAEDGEVAFSVSAGFSHGLSGPLFGVEGKLKTGFENISADLASVTFGDEHIGQYWLDDEMLSLLFYIERGPTMTHGSTTLVIKTRSVEEGVYEGRYEVNSYEVQADEMAAPLEASATGGVTCLAD